MKCEKVLLCAPYRFESKFLRKISENTIRKDLYSAIMPGTNSITRRLIKYGLNNNYGINNQETLETQVQELHNGEYQIEIDIKTLISEVQDSEIKNVVEELLLMTKGTDIKGFDDCRIIDVITKSYAAKLIDDVTFSKLFEEHSNRIISSYSSWEQYFSSFVLGKIFQIADNSWTITTLEEALNDVYGYCIAPVNVFSYSNFWQDYNLEKLGLLLAKLIGADYYQDKETFEKEDYCIENPNAQTISTELIEKIGEIKMTSDDLDLDNYDYISNLAEYVLWDPIVANELDWMFIPKDKEQKSLLMPKEFTGLESTLEYWVAYDRFADYRDSKIFAMLTTIGIKALFTEKSIYHVEKKLFFKKYFVPIAWEDAKFEVELDLDFGTKIKLNGKKIFDSLDDPDYEAINLTSQELKNMSSNEKKNIEKIWSDKLKEVLEDIPNKIKEFKKLNNTL